MVWGKMILESNGLSYMDFKLEVDVNKAMNYTLNERYLRMFFSCEAQLNTCTCA